MKRLFPLLFCLTVVLFIPQRASANDVYYIELGTADTMEQAQGRWQELLDEHTALLEGLQHYPREIIRIGKSRSVHIQAGILEEKAAAQHLCNRLFAKDVSCFIVEGLPPGYMRKERRKKVAQEPLPWLAQPVRPAEVVVVDVPPQPAEPQPQEASEEGGLLSWVFGSGEAGQAQQPQAESADSRMEVAEAIRVPLTEDRQAVQADTRMVMENAADSVESGWLMVEPFREQSEATGFWKQVRASAPGMAAGLRVLVVRPYEEGDAVQAALNIGPFAGEAGAMNFCREAIQELEPGLTCRFDHTDRRNADAVSPGRGDRGAAYKNRRRGALKRIDNEKLRSVRAQLFWLQLASKPTQLEAAAEWERISLANEELLAGVRSGISPSKTGRSYVVRVGPFSTKDEATGLCYRLKQRDVDCQVYGGL